MGITRDEYKYGHGTRLGIEDLITIVRFPLGLVLEVTPHIGVLGTYLVRGIRTYVVCICSYGLSVTCWASV